MDMVVHQAISIQGEAAALPVKTKQLEILFLILVILEDDLLVDPSDHDVVNP